MNFNIPKDTVDFNEPPKVAVGNVYKSKNTHKSVAFVVVAVSGINAHVLGIGHDGEITTASTYATYALERRKLIGTCDLDAIEFDIQPV